MNCKPGDLAVMVRSEAGNEGLIVTCLRLATFKELWEAGRRRSARTGIPTWVIDRPMVTAPSGLMQALAKDEFLRPIRPGDVTDEEVRDLYADRSMKDSPPSEAKQPNKKETV